jgi:hypothetical protein
MTLVAMRRHRRLLAGLAVAIITVAACLPGLTAIDYAVFERPWTLVLAPVPQPAPVLAADPAAQPLSLRSLLPSRAPPRHVAA